MKKILLCALAVAGASLPFSNAMSSNEDRKPTDASWQTTVESTADDPAALALLGLCILWVGIRLGRDRK